MQRLEVVRQGVAVQVAFESKGLKPGYHVTGSRVETRRFQARGELQYFNVLQPHQGVARAEPLVAPRDGARERPLVAVDARVRDEELALVEALPAALVRALEARLLAAVVLAHVLGQVLLPRRSGTSCTGNYTLKPGFSLHRFKG